MSALAVLLAALAGALVAESGEGGLSRLRASPPVARRPVAPWVMWGGVAVGVPVVGWALDGSHGLALGVVASLVAVTLVGVVVRQRRRDRAEEARREVVRAAETLASLIRSGRVPAAALEGASDSEVLAEARAEQAMGGDVADALLRASVGPGRAGLADLARAWRVAQVTGASMVEALDAVARALADEEEIADTVAAELAAPRATGRVMAVLPVIALGLGYSLGGDPVEFLLGSGFGNLVLVAGVGLACAGVWWTELVSSGAGGS